MKEGQDGRFGTLRQRRRRRAQALYEFETALHEEGYPDFVYDEGQDLFRFPEGGRFAFSKQWADVKLLEERSSEDAEWLVPLQLRL
jgi:hypothetical protein